MFVAPMKWLLLQNRKTAVDNDDKANLTDDSILEIFEDLAVYPDSNVILIRRFHGDFLELLSVYRPSPQRGVIWENRGNWTIENGLRMKTFDVASARRKNLQRTALKSCLVMTEPNTINHLTDFKDKSIDPVTKANYPWIIHLVNRMNATVSFEITNSWGYRAENGSWSGMIGMLDRREIDIGGTATFLVPERIGVVQYIQLYTHTCSRFVFRRPLLSTVSNIFILPFQRNVWIAIAVFLILVFCLLYLSIKWEYYRDRMTDSAAYWNQLNPNKPTVSDNLLILLGAFAQQGYSYEPYRVASRIVTLMLLLASLSLYAAYTANIVGLLQSTTDSIKTLSDLLNSPLKLGVQDVVYNRHYFKSFQDPVRKAILEQRIEPKGRKSSWMSIEEGVQRVRNELFAFQGEIGTMYQLMQDTYLEEEKCGLTEIDFLKVLYPLLAIQKQSPYLEIIKTGIDSTLFFFSDDTIRLSREMSSRRLMHGIRNSAEDLDQRIYNNLEHQNLYALDLNCDYAIRILRQAHSKRMFVAPMKWLLLQDRRTIINNDDNVTSTYDDSVLEVFGNLAVYPDSDVVLARRFDGDFLHLTSVYRPSPQRGVIWENRGNWTMKNGLQMRTFDVASARRRNLQQTALKSSIVMTNPDTINHLTDYKYSTIDPITKANYIWILYLVSRMNATISFEVADTWGYRDKNGSWNGIVQMLDRREIDIGTAMYLVTERIPVVEYIQLYTHSRLCFIFRKPLLSTVKNIFALPFQRNVWIAIAVFLVLVFCLLYISTTWEYYQDVSTKSAAYWSQLNAAPTVTENLLILIGAFAQQGYSYEPHRVPSRIVTLMLLLASLSLYASYTANIVALLQSTTDSIRTLSDLLYSPLKLGVQDVQYNRHYFKALQDPIRKAILEEKIEPKGQKSNWLSLEEGVRRIRNESFGFHGAASPIYQVIQRTFQEEEKCGLSEIDYINAIYPLLVIQKQSPYLEIIKNGALKLREYGLKYRDEYRLYIKKPVCSSQTSFITIGFTECYFAIVAMGYGALLSVIVFILELLWHKR
ncbi:uncharacterized protein LOC105426276 [Pogonomyrmex barbatus]|uniref:Uncharacterized protein LOC105426276 n=1 Tax=Pogonomyrmex barbatus TaxID=144034 RepID=A0A8N1S4M0_9HYME|nr:uncharacterized protein LOC105426276 [Pogonomyrmex barbatus]